MHSLKETLEAYRAALIKVGEQFDGLLDDNYLPDLENAVKDLEFTLDQTISSLTAKGSKIMAIK